LSNIEVNQPGNMPGCHCFRGQGALMVSPAFLFQGQSAAWFIRLNNATI